MNANELKKHIIDTYGLLDKQVVAHEPESIDDIGLVRVEGEGID